MLPFTGLFVAIGHRPNTDLFKGVLDMEDSGYLVTRSGSTYTNIDGVFACGDLSLGADVRCRDEDGETCACDRQQCLRSSKPACWNHVIPLP